MRVLRVRPPPDLPTFMAQVARQGPSSNESHETPDTDGDVLERSFNALTVPGGDSGIALLVEDAHRLPSATLSYVQFAIQTEPRLVIAFAGRPEVRDILAAPAHALLWERLALHRLVPPAPVQPAPPPAESSPTASRSRRRLMLAAVALIAVAAGAASTRMIATWPAATLVEASVTTAPAIRLGTFPENTAIAPDLAVEPDPPPPAEPEPAPVALGAPPPATVEAVPQPGEPGAGIQPPPLPPPVAPSAELPKAAPARVLLRYGHNSAAGLARAADLAGVLRQRGLQVTDPVSASVPITVASVGFFYADDRPSAERVAQEVAASAPPQHRLPASGALPPPGTIEVLVAGP